MSLRVLVADDDRALQVLLHVLLTRAGFDVDAAYDGKQALEKMNGHGGDYAVVMLDLILPEVSGIEVLQRLQQEKPEVLPKIIVLTSASRGVIDRIDTSQIHSLIRKPFDIQDVIRLTAACAHQT
jgi:two-component system alkaline phosphatase synthesis response regulator PhoP